jgi:cation diffusion facilitator CzcD-associated flavoprotein CzcO
MRGYRIGIVGSGFAGLCAAIRLQRAGFEDFTIFERAADIGGTWRDNTYPGCACDIPSNLYSFSFEPNPEWTRMYPQQGEIQAYLRRVVEKYALRGRIRFGLELAEARFDEAGGAWNLRFGDGSTERVDILIGATGPLSKPALPKIGGLDAFDGVAFHSAKWRHDVDLRGKRVAVIGTGASAIQFVPRIAPLAAQVHVFQRTPPWVLPHRDRAFGPRERRLYRALPFAQRLLRWAIYLRQELLIFGFTGGARLQRRFRDWAQMLLQAQVSAPELRRRLTPDYAPGCKRLLISNDWYPALQRSNVELLAEGVAKLEGGGRVTGASGSVREVDVVIFATGFAATDFVAPMKIFGRGGTELGAAWKSGAATHLGISATGFPNMFLVVGPNTGLGHNSIVFMIESQVNYIVGALRRMRRAGQRTMEVRAEVQARSYAEVQQRMKRTVWASGCRSWYLTADGRNDTLWPGSTLDYWRRTLRFDAANYAAGKS